MLLYDLTSTYFESDPPLDENESAASATAGTPLRLRADRLALVVTPEGLPLAYEMFPGNTDDSTTLRYILAKIENQYGKAQRIWVMDRGVPTEDVLAEMRRSDPPVQYLVRHAQGTAQRLEKTTGRKALAERPQRRKVKLLPQDDEVYVFAESQERTAKERSMRRRKLKRLWARLHELQRQDLTRDATAEKARQRPEQGARAPGDWSM